MSALGPGIRLSSSSRARAMTVRLRQAGQQRPDRFGPPGGVQHGRPPVVLCTCALALAQIGQSLGQPGHQRRLLPRQLGRRPRGRHRGQG